MRTAAFVIGIVGGVFGSLVALVGMIAPVAMLAVEGARSTRGEWEVAILAALLVIFCLLAVVGAIFAFFKPRTGSLLLSVSALGLAVSVLSQPRYPGEGLLDLSTFPIVFAPLFLLAAALAFFGHRGQRFSGSGVAEQNRQG